MMRSFTNIVIDICRYLTVDFVRRRSFSEVKLINEFYDTYRLNDEALKNED